MTQCLNKLNTRIEIIFILVLKIGEHPPPPTDVAVRHIVKSSLFVHTSYNSICTCIYEE